MFVTCLWNKNEGKARMCTHTCLLSEFRSFERDAQETSVNDFLGVMAGTDGWREHRWKQEILNLPWTPMVQ